MIVGSVFTFYTAPLHHIAPSFWAGFGAGLCFLPVFWAMGHTTQQMGLTVAAIANKTSMVIPVAVILLIDPALRHHYTVWKLLALMLSLGAIILSNLNSEKGNLHVDRKLLIFPFLVFLGGALVDIAINLAAYYTDPAFSAWIAVGAFSAAALSGTSVLVYHGIIKSEKLSKRSILGGIILGIPNFFSLYFLVKTLDQYENDGATVYPLVNTGTILLNTLLSIILFKEHIHKYLIAGILCAIAAIFLLNM